VQMPTSETSAVDQIDQHGSAYCPITCLLTRNRSSLFGVARTPRG
jgi:hypothetical protein